MWLTGNGEQKGAYSLIPFNQPSANLVNRMGSVPKDALKALPTVDFVSEGIRITPFNMFSWIIR